MSHLASYRMSQPRLLMEDLYVSADPQNPEQPYGTGLEFHQVLTELIKVRQHYQIPISRQREKTAERFRELLRQWKADVAPISSLTEMAMHPAYQQIIGLGREAVPLILRELEREPDHWFWALKAITGVDPVESARKGRVREMALAWLRWGREQGLKW